MVAELLKHRFNAGEPADLFFWRDSAGLEADVVAERAGRLHALEIKSGRTVAADWIATLDRISRVTGAQAGLLFAGDRGQKRSGTPVYAWTEVHAAARRLLG